MKRPTLSAVTICFNEEEDLPGYLESFGRLADEIVIIDDGSTDRSQQICAEAKARGVNVKFIVSPRKDGEGLQTQRSRADEAATCDWVLQADVDCRLSKALHDEIRAALDADAADIYSFRLFGAHLNVPVKWGGWQSMWKPWLYRRGSVRWENEIHEKPVPTNPSARQVRLDSRMWHLGDDDMGERLEKNHRYGAWEAERLLKRGRRVRLSEGLAISLKNASHTYLRKLGFLDGKMGAYWALYVFYGNLTGYFLAWAEQNREDRERFEARIRSEFE